MFKRFLTSLSTVLMVIAIAMAVFFGWSKTGWKALAVPTGSMQPNISENSLVLVHKVSPQSLRVGDIITYLDPQHQGQTITHRITKTSMLGDTVHEFTTKGDANKVPDIPVTSGSVVGKVVWHVPYAGALLLGAKTWLGIALTVYVPAVILMVAEIRRLSAYWRLTMPKDYRLWAYRPKEQVVRSFHRVRYAAAGLAVAMVGASAVFAFPVYALLTSNVVSLAPNTLKVAGPTTPPVSNCSVSNTTNMNVSNSSNQTASSGNANTNSNNTGGNATSGNASNTNSTNVNIRVTNNGC